MKKTILGLAILSSVTIACQKNEMVEVESIRFAASLEEATKASFADGSANLIWSDYDNLAVYLYSSTTVTNGSLGSAVANIESGVGDANATFAAPSSLASSLVEGNNYFYAVYPAGASAFAENRGDLSVNVPVAQNGEFGKYQLCYATAPAVQTKEAINNGEVPTFKTFAPATSLVRAYLKLDPAYPNETAQVSTLSMTVADKTIAGAAILQVANGTIYASGSDHTVTVTLDSPITVTKSKGAYIDLVVLPASGFSTVSFASEGFVIDDKEAPASGFVAGKRLEVGLVMKDIPMLEFANAEAYSAYSYHVDGGTFKAEARLLKVNANIPYTVTTNQTWATGNVSDNVITMTITKSWMVGPRKFTVTITPTDPAYASLAKSVTMSQGGQTWYTAADLDAGKLTFNDDGSVTITSDGSAEVFLHSNKTDFKFHTIKCSFRDIDIAADSYIRLDNLWTSRNIGLYYGDSKKFYLSNDFAGDWSREFKNAEACPKVSDVQTIEFAFYYNGAGYWNRVSINKINANEIWNGNDVSGWKGTKYCVGLHGSGTITITSFEYSAN